MKSRRTFVTVIVCLALLSFGGHLLKLSFIHPRADDRQYLAFAYNTLKYGVYSDSSRRAQPGCRREPGYPFILGLAMIVHPGVDVETLSAKCVTEGLDRDGRCAELIAYLKLPNLVLLVSSALLACWFVYRRTCNAYMAALCFVLIAFSASYGEQADRFNSEALAGFLILALSLSFAAVRHTRAALVVLAVATGLLVLSKAIYLYFVPLFLGVCLIKWITERIPLASILQRLAVFLVPLALVVGPWMLRNARTCGALSVAGRSGLVMSVRANLNELPMKDYAYAFAYFTNFLPASARMTASAPPDIKTFFEDPRRNFKGRGYSLERKLQAKHRLNKAKTDELLKKDAQRRILEHFPKNLVMVPPLLLRGLTAETGYGLAVLDVDVVGTFGEKYFGVDVRALYWGNPYLRLVLGVSLFASLIWLCIDSLRARKFGSFLFTLPSLYLIGIQALVTHFIPRYGVPLLPVLYACLCIALFEAGVRLLRRNRERVAAG